MKTGRSMMWKWCVGAALALGIGFAASQTSEAAVLATWNFNGSNSTQWQPAAPLAGQNLAGNIASATLTFGPGFTATTAANALRGNGTTWGGTGRTIATTDNSYVQLNFTAADGYTLSVSDLSCIMSGSGTGVNGTDRWAASVDGGSYAFVINAGTTANGTRAYDITDTAAGSTVALRYYASPTAAGGTWGFLSTSTANHGITVNGTVEAIGGGDPVAPSVTTVAASGIGATTATANGDVTADGGEEVTERGVVYKTSSGVAITDNPTAAAAGGTGEFGVDLFSLDVNQIYYFRAYAENSVDTTLAANELSFWTLAAVPAAPTVDNPTATTLDVAVNANGNPASTVFAIQRTSDSQYLQADGSFGASAVWQTAAGWDTTTATGLSPETEYSFQVKARNGANVETAFGSAASESTTAAATGIWINPMSAGTPMGSYYLGDTLGEWFVNFEIGQTWWNYAQVGIGTSGEGTGYNWGEAGWYEDGEGSNKRVRRNMSGFQFTSVANHYVICQAKAYAEDDYTSKSGNGWGNSTLYPPADLADAYFAVSAINSPSGQDAAAGAGNPASEIDLEWAQNAQGHDVMVVAKLSTDSWTEPTQGTTYSAEDEIGAGTVVYVGSATTATASGLLASTTYDFKFYSENNGYYSEGATAQAATGACEPDAPDGLEATDIDETSFVANWDAVSGAASYRLDVSTSETFSSEGDTPEAIFTESMGSVASTTAIATHEANNGFDNDDYTMSSAGAANAADIRATSASSGYTGASGVANVWFPSTAGEYGFGIAGIDASGYGALSLSFGYRKESASANATFVVEYSTDGSTWTPVSVSGLPAAGASTGWYLVSGVDLPPAAASATLSLRWVKSGSVAMRLDDVTLEGTPSAPSFVVGYENLAVAGTSQLVDGLDDNTTYYFRARAVSADECVSANSATASAKTLEATGGPQTIDFPAISDKVTTDVVELSATASSGLEVSFSVFSGPAVIAEDGVTLTFTGAGEVSIVASQAGDEDWNPAEDVTRTFNVTKALATVTLGNLAQAYDGSARAVSVTTDPEDLTVDVTYDGEATVPTDPGSYEVVATVVDDIYQGSDTDTLVVSVAPPASFSATADGSSSVDLSFSANAEGNDVVIVVNGTGTFSDPSGMPAKAGEAFAGGTVVYVGTVSPQTHSDLNSCTPYYYKAWSYVEGFYSAGLTDDASTTGPDAPTGLAADVDYTSFIASWEASAGAAGYRLDVSTSPTFTTGGGGGSVYTVNFEDASKSSYGPANVTLNGVSWNLNEAVIGDLPNDRKNGSYSVRVRSNETANASGIVSMNEDLATGLSSITFLHAKYGTDADTSGRVEYSTNGGADWTSAGTFTVNSTTLTLFSVTNLNIQGNVRVRIVKTSGTTARYNIDDIALYPHVPPTPSFVAGYENLAVEDTSQEVAGLEEGTTYYFRVRAESDGECTSANSATASATTLEHLRVVLSKATVNVREAGEGRFFVRLNQNPGANAVVTIARSAGSESIVINEGSVLTFTPANWSAWQVVTLAAPSDENAVSESATFAVTLDGADEVLVEAKTLDDDIAANIALASSGTTVSGSRAYNLPNLIDGVHDGRLNYAWMSWTNPPKGSITVDIGSLATVSRIRLLNWDWTYRTHRYKIEVSQDRTSWSTLVDATGEDRQGWDDWPVGNEAFRYLRISDPSNSAGTGFCISELEIYGTRPPLPQPEFSSDGVNVREGGEGRFYVRLNSEPATDVVATIARIDGDENIAVQGAATVTFKAASWSAWQAVALVAGSDANSINETATFQISGPGISSGTIVATALDDDIGENLALASGGTTISGSRAYRLSDVIDGVHSSSDNFGYTMWTNMPLGTMTLDLQGASTVTRIRLLNWDWTYRVHRYKIESSLDGTTWTTLVDASETDRQGWDDWAVDNAQIRYLRLTGLSNSVNNGFCIPEWEVYGNRTLVEKLQFAQAGVNVREGGEGRFYVRMTEAPAADVVYTVSYYSGDENVSISGASTLTFKPTSWSAWRPITLVAGTDENSDNETTVFRLSASGVADQFITATVLDSDIGENLALATRGTTISGTRAYTLGNAIDGIHDVRTSFAYAMWTGTSKGTMTLDLQEVMPVARIRLLNWDWTYRAHRYTIQASQDGTTWTTVVDASGTDRQGWDDWAVEDVEARYLRFTALANSVDAAVCIPEWEVYGPQSEPEAQGRSAFSLGSIPISVLTSDGAADGTGWLAVDGDPTTAWVGQKAGGGYLVVEYSPTLVLQSLLVDVTEASLADAQILTSLDAEEWQPLPEDLDQNPVSLNFLWVVFPDDGTDAVPEVLEIWTNP